MEKVYTIEAVGRSDFCIGAFADYEKAKAYYEKAKTLIGKEDAPCIELTVARGVQFLAWQGEQWEIIECWEKKSED
jgi:hypothetical protein